MGRTLGSANSTWICVYFSCFVVSANAALPGDLVKYLPGYNDELPFSLQTGNDEKHSVGQMKAAEEALEEKHKAPLYTLKGKEGLQISQQIILPAASNMLLFNLGLLR